VPGETLAIVAGSGMLPRLIAEDRAARSAPYVVVAFEGVDLDWTEGHPVVTAAFEKPGRLFSDLRARGCRAITLAGGMRRPDLNPMRFDLKMMRLAPKIMAGLKAGDDSTLRMVTGILEGEGLALRAPHEILEGLLAPEGILTAARPDATAVADADRAEAIVTALGAVDVGQGAVVAQGICLAVETIQGTDAMLASVAATPASLRPEPANGAGVLFKGPKPGQDWRVDLPSLGSATIAAASAAGLAGIAFRAGGVLLLGRDETVAAADAAGLFLWGRGAGA
jgi:DUF1009 family protein